MRCLLILAHLWRLGRPGLCYRRFEPERLKVMLFPSVSTKRQLAGALAATLVGAATPTVAGAAPHAVTTLVCTNPAGHVSWHIRIDFDKGTVDSNPARISAAQISWRDATDGGNYTLDRKSGDLTVVLASSTGGYFIHDRCALDPLKPSS